MPREVLRQGNMDTSVLPQTEMLEQGMEPSVLPHVLPSLISNVSRYRSSSLMSARQSSMSKPYTNAVTKSAAFWMLLGSSVSLPVCGGEQKAVSELGQKGREV